MFRVTVLKTLEKLWLFNFGWRYIVVILCQRWIM